MAVNYRELDTQALLNALKTAGRKPKPDLLRACMNRRADLTPGLLEMLAAPVDTDWEDADPRWYSRIHAGHLLIFFREPKAIPIFMELLRDPENDTLADWFNSALASYGPGILPAATALMQDSTADLFARIGMTELLEQLAAEFPAERARVCEILRHELPPLDPSNKPLIPSPAPEKPNTYWTFIANALAGLHDQSSRPQIVALYRSDWMDEDVMGEERDYLAILNSNKPVISHAFNLLETYEELEPDVYASPFGPPVTLGKAPEFPPTEPSLRTETKPPARESNTASSSSQKTIHRDTPKVGRNDPCPCGSGRKYKQCHGK